MEDNYKERLTCIEPGEAASLNRAYQQVAAVKKVCSRRASVPLLAVDPYINLDLPILNYDEVHSIRNPIRLGTGAH